MKSLLISMFTSLFFFFGNPVLAETLLDKAHRNGDFTGPELVSIFMAQIVDCEARIPGFKEKAKAPLAQLKKTKGYLAIENSQDFKKLGLEATEVVKEQRLSTTSCTSTLNQIYEQIPHFQKP